LAKIAVRWSIRKSLQGLFLVFPQKNAHPRARTGDFIPWKPVSAPAEYPFHSAKNALCEAKEPFPHRGNAPPCEQHADFIAAKRLSARANGLFHPMERRFSPDRGVFYRSYAAS
jgi:hypothetical protein